MEDDALIQASVAVYPLNRPDLSAVDRAVEALRASGLDPDVGTMQTVVSGPTASVFAALRDAFDAAAADGRTVMTVTISNACPLPSSDSAE